MATKCMSCRGAAKKMKKGGITQDIVGMPGYNATTRPITMGKGGVATMINPKKYSSGGSSTAVQDGCPPGTARLADGGCGDRPLYGG
jgi:hypothetical protein